MSYIGEDGPDIQEIGSSFLTDAASGMDRLLGDGGGSGDGSMVDDVSRSAKQAYKAGKNAVKMGKKAAEMSGKISQARVAASAATKTAASAGTKVAAVAGAKPIGIIVAVVTVVLLGFLIVGSLMSLPNAIYESVQETWEEIKYTDADAGNQVMNMIRFIGTSASKLASDVKDAVVNLWNSVWSKRTHDSAEEGYANQEDLNIAAQEATARLSIINKAIATNEKYLLRAGQLRTAVNDQQLEIEEHLEKLTDDLYHPIANPDGYHWNGIKTFNGDKSCIQSLGTDSTSTPNGKAVRKELEGYIDDIKDATTLTELNDLNQQFTDAVIDSFPISGDDGSANSAAVSLLYLASTQLGGSLENLKTSDYMRYLGYTGSGNTSFNIGHIVPNSTKHTHTIYGSVRTWQGTFKPQYLMEEMKHYQSEQMIAEATGKDTRVQELENIIEKYKNSGIPMIDLLIELDFPNLNVDTLSSKLTNHNHRWSGNTEYDTYTYTYDNPDGDSRIERVDHIVTVYYEFSSVTTRYRWYNIYYNIKPRTPDTVMSLVGFWNGSFDYSGHDTED